MSTTILLAEDEHGIASAVEAYLERDGYGVVWVRSGEDAMAELRRHDVALAILDVGLAGKLTGLDVLRAIDGEVPAILLTARDEESDRVSGLELGADDFLGKPFSPRELVARVRAVLRRATRAVAPPERLTSGPLMLDTATREASLAGEHVELTRREFDLVRVLLEARPRVLAREVLLERVWGEPFFHQTRTVEVHVAQVRRKLGDDVIRTVRGIGYAAR